jgi:ribose 1,5-bisphosphokinase
MTETTTTIPGDGRIGPGRLVLVVGPSGAGKDTLIALAKQACANDAGIAFPRRIVTRESSAAEDHDTLSHDAFAEAIARDAFAVHWQAHGHRYGLPRTIDDALRAGQCVVVNVSRAVVAALRAAYADVVVVLITAPAATLAQRLAGRARASDGALAERLHQAAETAGLDPDVTICNVGAASEHVGALLEVLRRASWCGGSPGADGRASHHAVRGR